MSKTVGPLLGKLQWFDITSGDGMVIVGDESLYLHYSCIAGIDKNGYSHPTTSDRALLGNLKPGDPCRVTIYENLSSRRIETAEFDLQTIVGE